MTERDEEEQRNDRYPDPVLKSGCLNCQETFYPRMTPTYCPYCGSDLINDVGNGVVCHNAE